MSAADVVERYLALIADHDSDPAELAALLHEGFRFVERPNLVSPRGSERDREEVVRSLAAGRELLSSQRYDVRDHLVSGDRVVSRVVWTGTVARTRDRSRPARSCARSRRCTSSSATG